MEKIFIISKVHRLIIIDRSMGILVPTFIHDLNTLLLFYQQHHRKLIYKYIVRKKKDKKYQKQIFINCNKVNICVQLSVYFVRDNSKEKTIQRKDKKLYNIMKTVFLMCVLFLAVHCSNVCYQDKFFVAQKSCKIYAEALETFIDNSISRIDVDDSEIFHSLDRMLAEFAVADFVYDSAPSYKEYIASNYRLVRRDSKSAILDYIKQKRQIRYGFRAPIKEKTDLNCDTLESDSKFINIITQRIYLVSIGKDIHEELIVFNSTCIESNMAGKYVPGTFKLSNTLSFTPKTKKIQGGSSRLQLDV